MVQQINITHHPVFVLDYTNTELFGEGGVPPDSVSAITFDVDIWASFYNKRMSLDKIMIQPETIDPAFSVDELNAAVQSLYLSNRTLMRIFNGVYGSEWKETRTCRAFVPT